MINRVLILTLLFVAYSYSQTTSTTPTTALESVLGMDVNLDGATSSNTVVYLISNLGELLWLSENVNSDSNWSKDKVFLQTEDIDASETKYWDDYVSGDDSDGNDYNDPNDSSSAGANDGWIPIGYGKTEGFEGFYNGDYHRIISLHIKRSSTEYIGFVSSMSPSVGSAGLVRLGVIRGDYTVPSSGGMDIGGIMGAYRPKAGNKFDQVFFEGRIENQGDGGYVAGLVGYYFATSS